MLAQIGLSPDALLEASAAGGAGLAALPTWEALMEALYSHGTLLLASKEEMARFVQLLRSDDLTVDEKKRLTALMSKLKKENRIDVPDAPLQTLLSDVASKQELVQLKGEDPLLAVLPEDTFTSLFPQAASGVAPLGDKAGGAEASVVYTCGQSSIISRMRGLADAQNYPDGTPREKVWRELFAPLAKRFSRVSISDRYLMSELINREGRGTSAQYRDPEHVTWLLQRLDQVAHKGTQVTILTQLGTSDKGSDAPVDADSVLDMIDRHWEHLEGGNLSSIEVYGVQWRSKFHPHGRHIRFGDALGFKLDEGLDRLAQPIITYKSGFSYTYAWKPDQLRRMRGDEALIRDSAGVNYARWDLDAGPEADSA